MLKNVGSADRVIRLLIAVLVLVLYLTDQISGVAAIILGVVALILLATSLVGFCPIYYSLKWKTIKKSA